MAVANCPSCGGQIEFKIGSSAAVICDHCRTVVARTDRGLEDLGKVAPLVDTGSPLRRDLPGKIRGAGFRLVGRTQMRHPMGGVWDEWYAAFDSGQWGWIAEAQGKYYVTVKEPRTNLPPYDMLQVGGMYDGLTVSEVGTATVIAGEGEIPWRVEPNSTYEYADLSGANNRFATIDYSEQPPLFFDGEETTLEGLGINVDLEQPRVTRVKVAKLACSQCGGPLNLVAPEQAERIVCPNCGALHDIGEGNLKYLETLRYRGPQPLVPLGKEGTIQNEHFIVAGFMQRSVVFDKKYYWTEYLLFQPKKKSFAWLVEDGGHWSFVKPINAGSLHDPDPPGAAPVVEMSGKQYRIFQDTTAMVESVAGEFYWKVSVNEMARAVDYIAPPEGISKEFSDTAESHEINYSHALYMTPDEIEAAFGVTGLPRPTTLGTLQPIAPGQKAKGCVGCGMFGAFVAGLLIVAAVLTLLLPRKTLLTQSFHFSDLTEPETATTTSLQSWDQPVTSTEDGEVHVTFFSKPFNVNGGHNLEVNGVSYLDNTWCYVDGNLFNEKTGLVEPFELKMEHYEGYDDGERWTEGSQDVSAYFSTLAPGTYSLRMEAYFDAKRASPVFDLKVREGVFSRMDLVYLGIAILLLLIPIWLANLRRGVGPRGFTEADRWRDSMFTPYGKKIEDDDDSSSDD